MAARLALAAVICLAMMPISAAPGGAAGVGTARVVSTDARPDSHVLVIVLENREYEEVIGNPDAAFFNRLAGEGTLANRYFGVAHPSLPNYLAMLGGSTFGIAQNCNDCWGEDENLALQLSRAGVSWRAYMEGLPHPCFSGDRSGAYVRRHDPFMYFPSIFATPRLCAGVVGYQRLEADLRRHTLPDFGWIEPGLCHGGHDCQIAAVDHHLSQLVPRLRRQLGPAGFLVITFDEGTSELGCCEDGGGGRVATVLIGPAVRRGAQLQRPFNHYSLLATLEDLFGVPRLREAADAATLGAAFR